MGKIKLPDPYQVDNNWVEQYLRHNAKFEAKQLQQRLEMRAISQDIWETLVDILVFSKLNEVSNTLDQKLNEIIPGPSPDTGEPHFFGTNDAIFGGDR